MTPWRAIAFHTDDSLYNEMIMNLRKSFLKHGVPYYINTIPKQRSWRDTHRYMHGEIRKAFDLFPLDNIIFLDADAVVRQYPVLFDTITADVAFNYNWKKKRLRAGTLYFKNCKKVKRLVEMWGIKSKVRTDRLAGSTGLDEALTLGDYDIYRLPDAYTKIFDNQWQVGEPVIEHFQASRRIEECGISLV